MPRPGPECRAGGGAAPLAQTRQPPPNSHDWARAALFRPVAVAVTDGGQLQVPLLGRLRDGLSMARRPAGYLAVCHCPAAAYLPLNWATADPRCLPVALPAADRRRHHSDMAEPPCLSLLVSLSRSEPPEPPWPNRRAQHGPGGGDWSAGVGVTSPLKVAQCRVTLPLAGRRWLGWNRSGPPAPSAVPFSRALPPCGPTLSLCTPSIFPGRTVKPYADRSPV